MRSSAIILAGLSALALAAPVQKRAYVTDVVIDYVTVFVTESNLHSTRETVVPSTLTTLSEAVVTPTVSKSVAPVPTQGVFVESKPVPTPTPTPEPIVETPTPTPTPQAPATTQAPQQDVAVEKPVETTPVAEAPAVVKTTEAAAPTTAAPATASPASGDYKSAVLFHHNVHRTNHSAPALTYDETLAGYALQVAKTCVFEHDTTPGGGGYGQNLAQSGSTGDEKSRDPATIPGGAISNQWYNGELPLFDPSMYGQDDPDMSNFSKWGHFSQVVWKDTNAVGCATVFCDSDSAMFTAPFSGWYTVCNYGNPGNVGGQYASNVLKPLGQSMVAAN